MIAIVARRMSNAIACAPLFFAAWTSTPRQAPRLALAVPLRLAPAEPLPFICFVVPVDEFGSARSSRRCAFSLFGSIWSAALALAAASARRGGLARKNASALFESSVDCKARPSRSTTAPVPRGPTASSSSCVARHHTFA